jgi:hypothetical protein
MHGLNPTTGGPIFTLSTPIFALTTMTWQLSQSLASAVGTYLAGTMIHILIGLFGFGIGNGLSRSRRGRKECSIGG